MGNNLKLRDSGQVLRSVYDVDKNCLRVCLVDGGSGEGPAVEVIIDHTSDSIRLGDGTKLVTATTVSAKVGIDGYIINAAGSDAVNIQDGGNSITVDAIDLDIRDLTATSDNVAISDGISIAKIDAKNKSISANRYEKILPLLTNAKWLELVDYEAVETIFVGDVATLNYKKADNIVATAEFTFVSDIDWSFTLESYINDDDGSILLDDDSTPLFLD